MKFTINRQTWYRGKGPASSRLIRPGDGMRCCLGFCGAAYGIADDIMLDLSSPAICIDAGWPDSFINREFVESKAVDFKCTGVVHEIIKVNDSQEITDEVREAQLKELFGSVGIEVYFVESDD